MLIALDELLGKIEDCENGTHLKNIETKYFLYGHWDEQEHEVILQAMQQKEKALKELGTNQCFASEFSQEAEPKSNKTEIKKTSRTLQEIEFLEKAHDYLQKIKDLKSGKATIEVADVFGEYASPEELLDAMEIGGLITCVNQLVGIWTNRKNKDDVAF